MSLISLSRCSLALQSVNAQSLVAISIVPCRNVWGKVNTLNPRSFQRPNRHWNPRFRVVRSQREGKIQLPDVEGQRKLQKAGDIEGLRESLKKQGLIPSNPEREYPIYMGCTSAPLDPFVPPESDGVASVLSLQGAKQRTVDTVMRKGKSFRAVRKIRSFEEDFDPNVFVDEAQRIYIEAHKALAEKKTKQLEELVTENAYPKMMHNTDRTTIYWDFVKSLEPPRVVHVRCGEVLAKENMFGQVTVRLFSQQILAVYDRFGRLVHGHPHVAKDVLEYVVFEKHVANLYGKWRLHEKITPDWLLKQRPPGTLTHIVDKSEISTAEAAATSITKKATEKSKEDSSNDADENVIYDKYGNVMK